MTTTIPIKPRKLSFHLARLFKHYWHHTSRFINILFMAIIAITGALQVYALLALNDWNKSFFNAIQAYDTSRFFTLSLRFTLIVLTISASIALNNYFVGVLGLKWRIFLTHKLKALWLTQLKHLHLHPLTDVDNPEQRISDDLNLVPQLSLKIVNNLFQAMITIVIFGSELWLLSKQWGMHYHDRMITLPGMYLWSALCYALMFNVVVFTLGHKLIRLNYLNQKLTATFRYMMSLIRSQSSLIVAQALERHHHEVTNKTFDDIITNALAMLRVDRLIQFIRQLSMNAGSLFIFAIALPAYFAYHLQIGYLMQVSGAALFFIKGLSVLMDAYDDIAQLRASLQRVSELSAGLEKL